MVTLHQFIKENFKESKRHLIVKLFDGVNCIARFPLNAFYDCTAIANMCTKYKVCTFDGVQDNIIYLQGKS